MCRHGAIGRGSGRKRSNRNRQESAHCHHFGRFAPPSQSRIGGAESGLDCPPLQGRLKVQHPPPNALQPALGSDCGGKHRQMVDGRSARLESMPLLRNRHIGRPGTHSALPRFVSGRIVGPQPKSGVRDESLSVRSEDPFPSSGQNRSCHFTLRRGSNPPSALAAFPAFSFSPAPAPRVSALSYAPGRGVSFLTIDRI